MEGDVAADQVAAVGEAGREPAGLGQQHEPRRFHRAAGEDEQVGFLLDRVAVGVLVDRRLDLALAVEHEFANDAVGAQLEIAGGDRVRDEDVERRRARAGRVAMLLREGADHRRLAAVEGPRQGCLRRREGVPAERVAALHELLRIARHRHRRAGIAAGVAELELVGAGLAGNAERPLHLQVVGLEIVIGDRPVGEVVPGRSPATVRRRKSFSVKRGSQPCQCTVPPPTICGTGQNISTRGPRRLRSRARCAD